MIATKVSRLATLLQNSGSPNHESISDSCLDGANYFFLLAMLQDEDAGTVSFDKNRYTYLKHINADKFSVGSNGMVYVNIVPPLSSSGKSIEVLASDAAELLHRASNMFPHNIQPRQNSLDFYTESYAVNDYIKNNGDISEDFPYYQIHYEDGSCLFQWTGEIPS